MPQGGEKVALKNWCEPNLNQAEIVTFSLPQVAADGYKETGRAWNFQFAYQRLPQLGNKLPQERTFYDTDNSGTMDLILMDTNHELVRERATMCEAIKYARRDSNPQPMVPKTIALSS